MNATWENGHPPVATLHKMAGVDESLAGTPRENIPHDQMEQIELHYKECELCQHSVDMARQLSRETATEVFGDPFSR